MPVTAPAEAVFTIHQIDKIVHWFNYLPFKQACSLDPVTAELYREVVAPEVLHAQVAEHFRIISRRVPQLDHYLAHAASAYFCSERDKCLLVVIDGMGETHGASVYEHGELRKLNQISARDSIGILYSLVTLHIGFNFNSDEYKIVWLAAYGDPEQFRDFFECAVTLKPDGTIRVPLLPVNRSRAGARTIL